MLWAILFNLVVFSGPRRLFTAIINVAIAPCSSGQPPARKVFHAIIDDFEDILVTRPPVTVPPGLSSDLKHVWICSNMNFYI